MAIGQQNGSLRGAGGASGGAEPTVIGPSILISGRLSGDEDLTVLGRVEGELSLTKTLIVESSGVVKAEVTVRNAVISGVVVGNVTATDSVELTREGRMVGDIRAPRVILVDGASFRGHIDMGNAQPAERPARPAQSENRGTESRASRPPSPPARPVVSASSASTASASSAGTRTDGPPRPPPPPARVETKRAASRPPAPPPRPENRPLPPSAPTVGATKKKVVLRKKGR